MNTRNSVRTSDMKKKSITFKTTARGLNRYPWYNPTTLIPAECEVLFIPKDEEGKPDISKSYTRVCRYLPGAISIWEDEWSDTDKKRKSKKIKLSYGHITVDPKNRNLLDYLRISGYNQGNDETRIDSSVLYFEVNHEKSSEDLIKSERDRVAAKNFVLSGDLDALRAIALALATNKAQMDQVHAMDEYTLRNSMLAPAKNHPENFLGKMKDEVVANKVIIVEALQKGVIKMSEKKQTMSWGHNGNEFMKAPAGMNPVDFFAELSVENDEYRKLFLQVKVRVNKAKKALIEKEEEKVLNKPWQEALIDEAIEAGRLIKKGGWYVVPGVKKGDDDLFSANGMRALISAVRDNDDNIIALLAARD